MHFEPNVLGAGSIWLELVHPDDHQRAKEFLDKLATMQTRQRIRLRMVPSEGPLRLVECRGNPVIDYRGAMTAIVVVTQRVPVSVSYRQRKVREAPFTLRERMGNPALTDEVAADS